VSNTRLNSEQEQDFELKSGIGPQNEIGNLPEGRKAKDGGNLRIFRGHFSRICFRSKKKFG